MDPEAIYQEVLQEEQQKGVSPAVAEGRAKAARQRAVAGSPHPKEPKWWPGAQPHLEGGEAAPAAEEAPAEEEAPAAEAPAEEAPAAEAPAEEAPAAEAPAEQPAAAEQPAEQPAAAEPAAAAAEAAPAAQPAAAAQGAEPVAPAPAAVTTIPEPAPAYRPTLGTSPGSPTGNRLRPEDAVSTDAQFSAQKALEQRRKLIDELVSTGVPAVTAHETGRRPSGWVSILFLVIPLVAVLFLVSNDDLRNASPAGGEQTETETGGGETGGGGEETVVTQDFEFRPDEVTTSGEIPFENDDSAPHNIYIYPDADSADAADASQAIFQGEDVPPGGSTTYDVSDVEPGEYPFICQIHPSMTGTITIE